MTSPDVTPLRHYRDDDRAGAPSFDDLRSAAMRIVQERCASTWTDHNLHDPGITLLEAGLWALTDLHARLDLVRRREDHPVVDLTATQRPGLTGSDTATWLRSTREWLGEAGPAPVEPAQDLDVTRAVDGAGWQDPDPDLAGALREALVALEPSAGTNARWTALRRAAAEHLDLDPSKDDLGGAERPTPGELALLHVRLAVEAPLEVFEDEHGLSLVWPPTPEQWRAVDPVTEQDLVAHAVSVLGPDAKAWVAPGAVAAEGGPDDPRRPGAASILIEDPHGEPIDSRQRVLAHLQPSASPIWTAADLAGSTERRTRRPLGLELHVGSIRRVPLVFRGTLQVRAASLSRVRAATTEVLRRVLAGTDRPHGRWPVCVGVDLEVVRRRLLEIHGVEGVRDLRVERRTAGPAPEITLLPFEVPAVDGDELDRLTLLAPGGELG